MELGIGCRWWWDWDGGEGRGTVNKGEAGGIMDTWGTVIGPQVDAVRGPVTPALERFYTFRFFSFFLQLSIILVLLLVGVLL
jgi:hypothetical protein